MYENTFRRAIQEGRIPVGTFAIEFASPGLPRLAAAAGAEFILLDMEHSGWSTETVKMLLAAGSGTQLTCLVRVPTLRYSLVAGVLDVGAHGVMAPMLETAQQAEQLVAYTRYPPEGQRGAAFRIGHDGYTGGDVARKIRDANRQLLTIAQIETPTGIANIEQICAVPGLDALWIGHFDLANFMGIPGQFDHPDYLAAVEALTDAARRHAKPVGIVVNDVADAHQKLALGFTAIAYGGDAWLYQTALQAGVDGVRALLKTTPPRVESKGGIR